MKPALPPCIISCLCVKDMIKSIKGDSRWCFALSSILQAEKHHPALVKVLCAELGVEPEALLDFELCLTDTQPGVSLQINH